MNNTMILILGVTASGKGRLAFDLARTINAEILSVDSMKVYRRMDIGTAKPPPEARSRINYHLIDLVEPSDPFSVGAFTEAADKAISRISAAGRPVVAVGGTALYIKAMLYGLFEGPGTDPEIRDALRERAARYGLARLHNELRTVDPEAADRINPNDQKRIVRALEVFQLTGKPISTLQSQFDAERPRHDWKIIGLRREKTDAAHRMNTRVRKMFDAGLVDEVKSLLAEQEPLSAQARCAIGYAETIEYLAGRASLDETIELIKKNTRRLAKNQRTWFKTFKAVHWIDVLPDTQPQDILRAAIERIEES